MAVCDHLIYRLPQMAPSSPAYKGLSHGPEQLFLCPIPPPPHLKLFLPPFLESLLTSATVLEI